MTLEADVQSVSPGCFTEDAKDTELGCASWTGTPAQGIAVLGLPSDCKSGTCAVPASNVHCALGFPDCSTKILGQFIDGGAILLQPGTYSLTYQLASGQKLQYGCTFLGDGVKSCFRTLVVADTTPPRIHVESATVTISQDVPWSITSGVTAIDGITGTLIALASFQCHAVQSGRRTGYCGWLSSGVPFESTSVPGTYSLVYFASDGAGNVAQASRTLIIVADTTPPVRSGPLLPLEPKSSPASTYATKHPLSIR